MWLLSIIRSKLIIIASPLLSPRSSPHWTGPDSVLAVLTGRLEYLGREELESEEARLVLQLCPELAPYFPPLELSGVVPLL